VIERTAPAWRRKRTASILSVGLLLSVAVGFTYGGSLLYPPQSADIPLELVIQVRFEDPSRTQIVFSPENEPPAGKPLKWAFEDFLSSQLLGSLMTAEPEIVLGPTSYPSEGVLAVTIGTSLRNANSVEERVATLKSVIESETKKNWRVYSSVVGITIVDISKDPDPQRHPLLTRLISALTSGFLFVTLALLLRIPFVRNP